VRIGLESNGIDGITVTARAPASSGATSRSTDQIGTVAAMELNPGKSRALLKLALTKTSDAKKIQVFFDQY
jgi:L-asparaginase